jgi:hypothetical protein
MKLRPLYYLVPVLYFFLVLPHISWAITLPEKLDYELQWSGITAGYATMHMYKGEDEQTRIVSTARSVSWITRFYPVKDRAETTVESASPWYPIKYTLKTREGRRRKHREVRFDRDNGKAVYLDYRKKTEKEYDIPKEIFDPMTAFYHVRFMDLEVGKSSFVPMFDSKKIWSLEIKVLKRERVKVPAGVFDTIKIRPLMKSEGIFSRKGALYIWFTDDEKRVPVKMSTKVAVGSINAVLTGGEY